MNEPAPKLVKELARIAASIKEIPKSGYNTESGGYAYSTGDDYKNAIREPLFAAGIIMIPALRGENVTPITTAAGATHYRTEATYRFIFTNGAESITLNVVGHGCDARDHGAAKAATDALKTALDKVFLLPGGEAPGVVDAPKAQVASAPKQYVPPVKMEFDPSKGISGVTAKVHSEGLKFGKNKGVPFSNIDAGYLEWLLKNHKANDPKYEDAAQAVIAAASYELAYRDSGGQPSLDIPSVDPVSLPAAQYDDNIPF